MSQLSFIPIDFDPFEEEREIDKIVFTNEPQKEIWLSCLIGGKESSLAYNESVSLDLEGNFHADYFTEAIAEVVSRHETLRSTVSANGETLIIYKYLSTPVPLEDISADPDQKGTLRQFIADEMQHEFDLQEGPLFRCFLHKLSETRHLFTLVKHHVIADGWSTGVILEELSKLYNAKVKGVSLVLAEAPQISQYAAEMAAFEQSKEYQQTKKYWLDMYRDSVPVLDLPTDYPRPARRTYKADRHDHHLSLELVEQVKKMGAKSGSSLVNTLLSAFEIFLSLQTNQQDIVVGLPAAGQAATGNFGLAGHCVNLLPIRSLIDPHLSFSDYLKKRKAAFFDAYDHQQFTFGELVKSLNIKRDPSRIPLVPVVFNIDMGMDNAVVFDHLTYQLISNPRAYETFEIFLNATGSKSSFVLEWSYNTQLFKPETIEKMAAEFELLLETLVGNSAVTLKELSAKNTAVWIAQLESWNATKASYPKDSTLTALIDLTAGAYPAKVALVYRNESLTYARLTELSNQLAACLIAKGVSHGDIIGLAADRSVEMVVSLLGILKAGAVYLPLDPEYPQERIEYMLTDSGAKILLLSKAYSGRFQSGAAEVVIEEIWPDLDLYSAGVPAVNGKGTDLAYVLYTSGSTGKPKGVEIMHYNLVNFLISMQSAPGITAEDRLLAITTISFDIAGLELYLPLITGAELVICDQETARDGRLLLELIEKQEITMMQATPSTWRMMIDSGWQKRYPLKVLCGGEAFPAELAAELLNLSAELWNMYGPTETTIWSTVKQIKAGEGVITIGRPINNTQVYILDTAHHLVAPGATGEIFIGGDGLAAGYLNQPELTKDRFIPNPFSTVPGAVLYTTGDLGKFTANGEILCLGRADQQVKIRGHRIELGEIETLLSQQEGIKQSVVIAREDNPGDKRLVGYVILSKEETKEIVPSWKDRWDTIYDMAAKSGQDQELSEQKIDGILLEQWQDSEKLVQQAAEWLHVSAERIKCLHAPDILEIGSGGGQLMFELAPFAASYLATDYAATAIDKLREKLDAQPGKWDHVSVRTSAADDFSTLSAASFDLVVIHSVAQYFPDTAYFLKVIEGSIKTIKDGGCLFIGDMQGKNSLEMYHAMDYLSHAKNEITLAEFSEVVQNRVRIEDEFVADPSFFYLLPQLIPAITGVDVQLREGHLQNETTKYHYDVWIYVNSAHEVMQPGLSLDWEDARMLDNLSAQLKAPGTGAVTVTNIPNSRTTEDHALLQWMRSAPADSTAGQVKAELESIEKGIDPDLFWQLGRESGHHTYVRWTTDGTDGNFEVVFIRDKYPLVLPPNPLAAAVTHAKSHDFARIPLSANELYLPKSVTDGWKKSLHQQLPDYMVPADYVALKSFPLTPNHKIDKKALPKPQMRIGSSGTSQHLPQNEQEQFVSSIWSAVLGIENIDTQDDFFELGGHSLLAVKVMSAIEKETGKRLPLATLFDHSTIEKLAKKLTSDEQSQWKVLVPIKTTGTKDPIFLIHGGGLNVILFKAVSKYLDEEQPVYGLQAQGLYGPAQLLYTMEEIAALYISEIITVNPDGPYCLAGYSLGGFIAFEISRQLTEMGKTVKFLGILDTYAGNKNISDNISAKLSKKVKRQFNKIPFFTRSFLRSPREAIAYQVNVFKYKFEHMFSKDMESYTEHFTPYEKEIFRSYDIAHLCYQLAPADIKISLFNVRKRLYYLDDLVYLGWDKLANKGIEIHGVPGDHKTFLYPPNDEEFARILQAALDNI